jgi:hypothetical protein
MMINDMKKGDKVIANGFEAEMADNKKGMIRMVRVLHNVSGHGEIGSVYMFNVTDRNHNPLDMTPTQQKQAAAIKSQF